MELKFHGKRNGYHRSLTDVEKVKKLSICKYPLDKIGVGRVDSL